MSMCYSAMIDANLRNLEHQFRAEMDWGSVTEAFQLRDSYKMAMIPAAIDSYIIQNARSADQKRLAKLAKDHYQREIQKFSAKQAKYEQDVLDFEAKLKKGSTAKGLKDKLAKRRQSVEHLKEKISYYKKIEEQGAARVFPQFYTPAVVQEKGKRKIKLMRYHVLPATGKELIPL